MNHLLIGLGGTGGRVLKSFRKLVYQSFRNKIPDGISIDYLFVDSDPKSFRSDDPSWVILGHSVVLPTRSQLPIQQANLRAVIDDLNSHPNLKPWIGDRKEWGELLAGLNIDSAGGQKRRLGRFLFAMSARRFQDSVVTLVRDLQAQGSRTSETTFHIFAGLAGGTGSGSIIDTVAQLRKTYPDPKTHRIVVYAYLPDLNPPTNWNTGNYHANAYAALLELNAMAAGAWAPFDVIEGGGSVKHDFWFNGCYVFTDDNDQGYRAPIDGDLTDILADFVFHKVVVARSVDWGDLSRFENSENGDAASESIAGSGKGQRAVRFMSFGIRRLSFPEETIREYLTYDFVTQAYHQLQHNNWIDGFGFSEQAKPKADSEFVADGKQRDLWKITDDHLKLVRPIIATDLSRLWKIFEDEWDEWATHSIGVAKQHDKKIDWLPELKKLLQTAYERGYRKSGVKSFYDTYSRDLRNLAATVKNSVESSLFEEWKVGDRALSECVRVVSSLQQELESRKNKFDSEITNREQSLSELQNQLQEVEEKWHQIGIIGSAFGSYDKTLNHAGLLLRNEAVLNTHLEALRFAKRLMGEISTQLTDFQSTLQDAEKVLANAATDAAKVARSRAPKENSATETNTSSYVIQFQDKKAIDSVRRKLGQNEIEQKTQAATVRAKIIAALGQQTGFKSLATRLAASDIRNIIVATSESNVESAHQRLITQREEKVLQVSLIEKLQQEWGTNPERIRRETETLVKSAGRFVRFDETEINKHFEGRSTGPRATETFAVMMPEPADQREFVERLKESFRNARSARSGQVSFIPMSDRGNEITLVSLVNLFPLRYAHIVKGLKDRYIQRSQSYGRARLALEVHSEGDGNQFPDIFVPDGTMVKDQARPLLLLGSALNVITHAVNPTTGQPQILILRKDEDEFELPPIVLGKGLLQAVDGITERITNDLRKSIIPLLAPPRFGSSEEMDQLRQSLQKHLNTIKNEVNGDSTHPELELWNQAAREVMKIARREVSL